MSHWLLVNEQWTSLQTSWSCVLISLVLAACSTLNGFEENVPLQCWHFRFLYFDGGRAGTQPGFTQLFKSVEGGGYNKHQFHVTYNEESVKEHRKDRSHSSIQVNHLLFCLCFNHGFDSTLPLCRPDPYPGQHWIAACLAWSWPRHWHVNQVDWLTDDAVINYETFVLTETCHWLTACYNIESLQKRVTCWYVSDLSPLRSSTFRRWKQL